jgi:hypothetical protein
VLAAFLFLVGTVSAQSALPAPSLKTLNASQTFSLPALASPSVYDFTLSLCSASGSTIEGTQLVFVSNDTAVTQPSSQNIKDPSLIGVSRGGLASVLSISAAQGAWVAVDLPSGWSAELGVGVNRESSLCLHLSVHRVTRYSLVVSLVPLHGSASLPLFAYSDSDANTALLTSPTFYTANPIPSYRALVLPTSSVANSLPLTNASCFLSTSNDLVSQINVTQTTRGVVRLSPEAGGVGDETRTDGARQQFVVSGLTRGTNYTVYGLETNATTGATRLWGPQHFTTKQGTFPALHNLHPPEY